MRSFLLVSAMKSSKIRTNCFYEGETDAEKAAREAGGNNQQTPPPKAGETNPDTGKKFTQEDVNRMLKADKDAAKKERDRLVTQMQQWQEQGLTTENMAALQERIDQLTNEGKTHEQLAKEQLDKKDREWAKKHDMTVAEAKKWRNDYETYRSKSEVLQAAATNKAGNPEQVYKILKPDISMVEVIDKDTNKGTGEWVPRVKLNVTEDGATKTLELSVPDAIKRMTEMEEHANLFNSGASSGLGGNNFGGSKGSGNTAVPRGNMASYMKARKDNPRLLEGVGKE